jgi:hypothetical protein
VAGALPGNGDGVCDGMAANAKRKVKQWEKDHDFIHSADCLVTVSLL